MSITFDSETGTASLNLSNVNACDLLRWLGYDDPASYGEVDAERGVPNRASCVRRDRALSRLRQAPPSMV